MTNAMTAASVRWKDLSGQRFGRLVVAGMTDRPPEARHRNRLYRCRCDCGAETVVQSILLTRSKVKSCGCLGREIQKSRNLRHGLKGTCEYRIYRHMLSRCHNAKVAFTVDNGGRGVAMCERWLEDPANFVTDMGRRPSEAHSIERVDLDGPYSPTNCRWATRGEQVRRRHSRSLVTLKGVQMSVAEAGARSGLDPVLLTLRMRRGWTGEELFLPRIRAGQRRVGDPG